MGAFAKKGKTRDEKPSNVLLKSPEGAFSISGALHTHPAICMNSVTLAVFGHTTVFFGSLVIGAIAGWLILRL